MAAVHFKLDNLVVIVDNNNFQQTGSREQIMDTKNLKENGKVLAGMYTN